MNQDSEKRWEDPDRLAEPDYGPAPNRLTWPLKRAFWSFEKHVLWPISDTFRRKPDFSGAAESDPHGPGHGQRAVHQRRRPLAYIGVTLLVAIACGATAAALYFHNQAGSAPSSPVVAEVPATPDAAVVPTPAETSPATETPAPQEETLQGVVPQFEKSAGETAAGKSGSNGSGSSGGDGADGNAGKKKTKTLVSPAPSPKSGPLKVAHNFALTFTGYEIGKKGAARKFASTSSPELAKELRRNPPKQPDGADVPRATVMNVVKGQKEGKMLLVSVSLRRSGATSELRLGLKRARKQGKKDSKAGSGGWKVSEVRG